ncbi:MAG: hypothetical protein IEMM0002_0893 [bacterium]|nr:MAG: hypothetical protein IEMM0002_0893 [bacterium]
MQVNCTTLSETGNVYIAECDVTPADQTAPLDVSLLPFSTEGVELMDTIPPDGGNGTGVWTLTFRFNNKKSPAVVRFELRGSNKTVMQVGSVYDPFKNSRPMRAPKRGRTVIDDRSRNIQLFQSK